MAANPLRQAMKVAERNLDEIGALFATLGDAKNPDSKILVAYRNANRALRSEIARGPVTVKAVKEITGQLKDSVMASSRRVLKKAVAGGQQSASEQLKAYGYTNATLAPMETQLELALDVIEAKVVGQQNAVTAMVYGKADNSLILGDASRVGVLRSSDVITTASYWAALSWWLAWGGTVERTLPTGDEFAKQVVAALDENTTETCLRAHGQVQPLSGRFHLTGTPRFADYMEWTPFHHRCRSSIVLYLPGFDDGLTARMRSGADQILRERAAGGSGYRDPADAFS